MIIPLLNKMYEFYDSEIVEKFELSEEAIINERKIIESNKKEISDFQKKKLIDEVKKNWDKFYNHYKTKFFKDRNWIKVEFERIFENSEIEKDQNIRENENINECKKKDECTMPEKDMNLLKERKTILEIGCGVGNTLIPLLMSYENFDFIGIDFSKNSIHLLNEKWKQICERNNKLKEEEEEEKRKELGKNVKSQFSKVMKKTDKHSVELAKCEKEKQHGNVPNKENRCTSVEDILEKDEMDRTSIKSNETTSEKENVEECFTLKKYKKMGNLIKTCVIDITENDISSTICEFEKADIILLIFVLSSIYPPKMKNVVTNAYNYLKKGGHVILRDYGIYDLSQVRFAKKKVKKMSENMYVRGDKTFVYFFKTEELRDLFCKDNYFEEVENRYITRIIKNRKRNLEMKRIWVQGIFRKI